jgi:hypothetical protein
VAGVDAEVDQFRIDVAEEPFDALLCVDVGVGVRVKDQFDSVLLEQVGVRPRSCFIGSNTPLITPVS